MPQARLVAATEASSGLAAEMGDQDQAQARQALRMALWGDRARRSGASIAKPEKPEHY